MFRQQRLPLTKWQRHFAMFKYSSFRKLVNLVSALWHYALNRQRISSQPSFMKIEVSRYCTVNCKLCNVPKARQFFDYEEYQTLVDRYQDTVFEVSLYDDGEPLLHDRVIEFIRYAHERRIGTIISTSLSFEKSDAFWEELAGSGLDRLIVAIDGVTSDVYKEYRTNGNLELVMANLRKILEYKKQLQSPMVVEWQMIDFPWNRIEQDSARALAADLGCNHFRLITDSITGGQGTPKEYRRSRNCLIPFLVLIIDAYRKVHPCYIAHDASMVIGDLSSESIEDIWNGSAVGKIRDKKLICHRQTCQTCKR